MNVDQIRLDVPSAQPRQDAETIRDALRASTSDWPIPGEWRIGFKGDRLIVILDVPHSPVTRWHRVGLFRWAPYTVDETQAPFAFEQLRQRWPRSIELPKPTLERVV